MAEFSEAPTVLKRDWGGGSVCWSALGSTALLVWMGEFVGARSVRESGLFG
jgi:hypothetical protein